MWWNKTAQESLQRKRRTRGNGTEGEKGGEATGVRSDVRKGEEGEALRQSSRRLMSRSRGWTLRKEERICIVLQAEGGCLEERRRTWRS